MSLLSCWTSNIGRRKCATINQMGLKWQCIEKSKCFCWKDHESLHLYWLGSFLLPNLWRAGVNQTSFGVKWCQLYFEVSCQLYFEVNSLKLRPIDLWNRRSVQLLTYVMWYSWMRDELQESIEIPVLYECMEEDQSCINATPVSVCSANTSPLYNARISNNLNFRFQIKNMSSKHLMYQRIFFKFATLSEICQ